MIHLGYFGFKKCLGVAACILFFFCFFGSMIAASDFDFYATDLITKESYKRISMDFKDASLKNILKIFSEQAGLNFIAAQNVQERTLTLYLDQVPLQEALNKIMAANNLRYELDPGSNIFIVKEWGKPEVETITKIYNLKYARLKDSKLESAIAAGSTVSGGAAGGLSGAASGGGGGGAAGGAGGGKGSTIEDTVKSVLTSNGKLTPDMRTNSLIISDIPSQFEVIDKVIALVDVPTPQVMIEVEMLDVSKKLIDEMGVDTTSELVAFTGTRSRSVRFPAIFAHSRNFTYGTISNEVFSAVLDLLTTDTKTKFLARPRILTATNQTAEIKITTNEAIGLKTTTESSQGTATQTVEAERFETGVSLKVTPQVDLNSGSVTMFVQPVVAEAKTGATFSGTTFKDPEVRTSATTLIVKNGETIVVGGLIRTKEEVTIKKIPFFGDIPIVGAAFRHKDKTAEERELLVFITPRIIGIEDAVALAKVDRPASGLASSREQDARFGRQEEVDNMLERWEN